MVGTPRYAPPEQLRGEPLDGRADQYAWGATAYELLSGRPPFEADTPVALISRVLTAEAPSLALIAPEVPAEVVAAVMRALAKLPDDRFATLDEAADAIEPFAEAAFASGQGLRSRAVEGDGRRRTEERRGSCRQDRRPCLFLDRCHARRPPHRRARRGRGHGQLALQDLRGNGRLCDRERSGYRSRGELAPLP
jgi:serine/threonine protein kinase